MNLTYEDGFKYALRILILKDYTQSQIHKKLKEKGFNEEIAEKIVFELTEKGYINEEKLLRREWEKLQDRGDIGIKAFIYSLKIKGFTDEAISLAESFYTLEEEKKIVLRVINIYLNKLSKKQLNERKIKQKVFYYLQGKGFSQDSINLAMESLSLKERGD